MLTAVVSIVSAVAGGGAVAAFFKWLTDRKVAVAEVKSTEADVWQKVLESYSLRIDQLQQDVGAMRADISQLKEALDREEHRVEALAVYARELRSDLRAADLDVRPVPDSLRDVV